MLHQDPLTIVFFVFFLVLLFFLVFSRFFWFYWFSRGFFGFLVFYEFLGGFPVLFGFQSSYLNSEFSCILGVYDLLSHLPPGKKQDIEQILH